MSRHPEQPGAPVLDRRRAGVLLHPTSLPGPGLGADAIRFMDFMANCGFSVWQMLPLGPGDSGSPYSPGSAFAGNPNLLPAQNPGRVFSKSRIESFLQAENYWLPDFALYATIKSEHGGKPWWLWPEPLRNRQPEALAEFKEHHAAAVGRCIHGQMCFSHAWQVLKSEAEARNILLFGDLPMFVPADSADVWAHPELFQVNQNGLPVRMAGAPPDDFTLNGQCWGNPVYHWERMEKDGFDWWLKRLQHEFRRFDLLRWDHFRGLVAGWEIPVTGDEPPSAANGCWHDVPGRDLLRTAWQTLGPMPIIAENLGVITDDVEKLRREFSLPGMHILQFAFDGNENNPHLPKLHESQAVVYTGTHDNDTIIGWYQRLDDAAREMVCETLGVAGDKMPSELIRATLGSKARLAVIPMQDILSLGSSARMNIPGEAKNQWRWGFDWHQVTDGLIEKYRADIAASIRQPA